jgi:hypothetical protein
LPGPRSTVKSRPELPKSDCRDIQDLLLPSHLQLTVSQLDLKLCQKLSLIGVLAREIQDATISSPYLTLRAVQCDQTTIWATPRIMCREEVGQSLQGRVRFLLRVRLQHVNNIDCSSGTISARRRGLGIFAVAQLAQLPDTCRVSSPICTVVGPANRALPWNAAMPGFTKSSSRRFVTGSVKERLKTH